MPSSTFSRLPNRRQRGLRISSAARVALCSLALAPMGNAFSFNIDNTPSQCQNISISITGSGGTPPYRALVVPFGQTPLENNVEARTILDQPFDGDSTSVSFQLKYPALSQFVVVVSDSKNFGAGGTSSAASVVNSSDSSCFSTSQSVQSDFVFNTDPLNQIVQCSASRLWWTPSNVQGTPRFYGIIPGGDSFNITVQNTTPKDGEGTGFNWTPNVRGGTTLLLGAGDDRGLGAGGSVTYIVSGQSGSDTSCLDSSAPSSTAGSPAGGSYPTSTQEAENGGSTSSNGTNVGAIVGGVVAGVVVICAFILVLIFLRRRKQKEKNSKERPDLFTDNERPGTSQAAEIERLAPPEPYIVPSDTGPGSEYGGASSSGVPDSSYGYGVGAGAAGAAGRVYHSQHPSYDRRQSAHSLLTTTDGDLYRPGTPGTSAGASMAPSRKGAPPVLRPVNIIQHEDAGAPPEDGGGEGEEETVELPPAYTNIRRT